MSQQQHIQHHQHQTHYVHYNPNPNAHLQQQQYHHPQQQPYQQQAQQHQQQPQQAQPQQHQQLPQQQQLTVTHVAPRDTQHAQPQAQPQVQQQQQQQPTASTSAVQQPQQQPQTSGSASGSGSATNNNGPIIARGDWTKELVQLAKTAELKKHALTLQLHTAHILSAHATLEQKGKAIQDLREQKNKLESERTRLLNALREVNEDRDKVDLMESTLEKECRETRNKIAQLTENEYAIAKRDVDRLRAELGQPPLPSLQSTLEEKSAQYLNERRLSGQEGQSQSASGRGTPSGTPAATGPSSANNKRSATQDSTSAQQAAAKRPRGRPKGSKNKSKSGEAE
ncbi:hypothetical protein CVT26_003790 [Gymnopilus dilepis]|uniref:Uncharacterized protein n=1 Tax=Gymnopilus dilepis TaxID=231916 RepID=A0A409W1P6_9AGAR|nr:hypothetical protein CVT26_003790 [Gymnopilus dilepis]